MKKIMLFAVVLITLAAFDVKAQRTQKFLSPFGFETDTVTNTGTAYLTVRNTKEGSDVVAIQVVCTKISGTTAGTLTLQGSLDGVNFYALTDTTSVPNINTFTATDVASQTFIWKLSDNPVEFYRVSWTGSGTMSATLKAFLLSR